MAEPSKPCPLLKTRKIHVIHVSSQWLSLLSVPSSKDPQDPREQSVAKPTERALF